MGNAKNCFKINVFMEIKIIVLVICFKIKKLVCKVGYKRINGICVSCFN